MLDPAMLALLGMFAFFALSALSGSATLGSATLGVVCAVIVWQLASHLLNVIIKNTIKAPRPDSQEEEFAKLKKTVSYKNYLTIHRNFGMPSGHAQATVSELTFIALYFKEPLLTAIALLQVAITLWQRYTTKRHSLIQLLAGSIIGVIVGVLFYLIILHYQ